MGYFSYSALQQAVYQKLSGSSSLMALVSGVFDRPPQGSAFPYITIGDMSATEFSNLAGGGADYNLDIYIWSRGTGHKQAATIMESIYALLHNGSMSVSGQNLVAMRVLSTTINLENDGITYRGNLKLQVLLTAS